MLSYRTIEDADRDLQMVGAGEAEEIRKGKEQHMNQKVIRVGTRGSALAMWQTNYFIERLQQYDPELEVEVMTIRTQGDRILDQPLVEFGGKGVFISEFEEALLSKRIDVAVHSAKDMPMELADGLAIAAALPRADVRDVLVAAKDRMSEDAALTIGTGSLRRQFQLRKMYPKLSCVGIRGNVPTRLDKIRSGEVDGVVLAMAGLERLGLLEDPEFDYYFMTPEEIVPAGGQGIIAVEGREGDELTELVARISNEESEIELETEREVLRLLHAGCHEAIGVYSRVVFGDVFAHVIWDRNGRILESRGTRPAEERMELARELVRKLR